MQNYSACKKFTTNCVLTLSPNHKRVLKGGLFLRKGPHSSPVIFFRVPSNQDSADKFFDRKNYIEHKQIPKR